MSRESKAQSHQIESYEPLVLMSASAAEIDITCPEDAGCAKSLFLQYLDGFRNLIEQTMVCDHDESGSSTLGLTCADSLLQRFDSCLEAPPSLDVCELPAGTVSSASVGFQEAVVCSVGSGDVTDVATVTCDDISWGPQIPDSFEVESGAVLASIVSGGSLEAGNNRVSLEFELLTPPAEGVLEFREDGSFEYLAEEGCRAAQSFTYQVFDINGNSEIRTVELSCVDVDLTSAASDFANIADTASASSANDGELIGPQPVADGVTSGDTDGASDGAKDDGIEAGQPAVTASADSPRSGETGESVESTVSESTVSESNVSAGTESSAYDAVGADAGAVGTTQTDVTEVGEVANAEVTATATATADVILKADGNSIAGGEALIQAATSSEATSDAVATVTVLPSEIITPISTVGADVTAAATASAASEVVIDGTGDSEVLDGGAAAETLTGADGDDTLFGRDGDDVLSGGAGSDNLVGGSDGDVVSAGSGDDHVWLNQEYGNDQISGGEQGESQGDTLYLNFAAGQQQVLLSGQGGGTVSNGSSTAQFAEMEHIVLSNNGDVLVLTPEFHIGSVANFTLPSVNADGSLTAVDTINVAALSTATGASITTANVLISADSDGAALLTFPSGESLKLTGVSAADLRQPEVLHTIGIPEVSVTTSVVVTETGADSADVAVAETQQVVLNQVTNDYRGSLFDHSQTTELRVTLVNNQPALGWNGVPVSGGLVYVAANGDFEFHPNTNTAASTVEDVTLSLTTVDSTGQTHVFHTTLILTTADETTARVATDDTTVGSSIGSGGNESAATTDHPVDLTSPADTVLTGTTPPVGTSGDATDPDYDAATTTEAGVNPGTDWVEVALGAGEKLTGSLRDSVPPGATITAVNGEQVLGWNGVPLPEGGTLYVSGNGDFDFYPGDAYADLGVGEYREVSVEYSVTDDAGRVTDHVITLVITGGDAAADAAAKAADGDAVVPPRSDSQADSTTLPHDVVNPDVIEVSADDSAALDGNLLANDVVVKGRVSAVNGHPLTGDFIDLPEGGRILVSENGDFNFDPAGDFDDLPAGTSREITFTYTAVDESGVPCEVTATIVVNGTLPQKVLNPDVIEVSADDSAALDGNLLANDVVVKGRVSAVNGHPLTGDFIDLPEGGRILVSENGDFNFDPAGDFDDLPAGTSREITFTYTAVDESGVPCEVTATIVVNGTLPQKVLNPDVIEVSADDSAALDGNLLANDVVVKGRVSAVNGHPLTGDFIDLPEGGRILVSENGDFNFDPDGDFDDLPAGTSREITFTYTAVDESGVPCEVTATIVVNGTLPQKVLNPDVIEVSADDSAALDGNLLANDVVVKGRVSAVNGHPLTGDFIDLPEGGRILVSENGDFNFDPAGDFDDLPAGTSREITFTYTAVDESGVPCEVTATIVVNGTDTFDTPDTPAKSVGDDRFEVHGDSESLFEGNLLANDDLVSGRVISVNGHPTNGYNAIPVEGGGLVFVSGDGEFRFDPNGDFDNLQPGEVREVRFTYIAVDEQGQECEATVTIVVKGPLVDPPVDPPVDPQPPQTASLGDRIWFDTNRDGLQSEGELGAPGIRVILLDANRNIVARTVTDADGRYLFEDLEPGKYTVDIDETSLPEGFTATRTDAGDDSLDSDLDEANPENFELQMTELEAGEVDLSHDLGLVQQTASLGDRIWFDTNRDGLQSEGELGAPGIRVVLLDANRNIVARTVTDADGRYLFEDLEPGKYTVDIDETSLPEGFTATRTDARDDSLDSDLDEANPENFELQMTELEAGEVDLSHDLGLVQQTASLGDRIWFDTNRDGLQSEGELGAPGIRVILLDANRNIVARTVTDADGRYLFEDLEPGKYTVDIDETSLPEGFTATRTDAGDDSLDSDLDEANPENFELQMTELEAGEVDLSHDLGLVDGRAPAADSDADVRDGINVSLDLLPDSIQFQELEQDSLLLTNGEGLQQSGLDFPFNDGGISPTIPIPQFGGVGGSSINLFGVDLPTAGLPIDFELPDADAAPAPAPAPAPEPTAEPAPKEPVSKDDECVTYEYYDCEPTDSYESYDKYDC